MNDEIETVLPGPVRARLDLDSICVEDTTCVDEGLSPDCCREAASTVDRWEREGSWLVVFRIFVDKKRASILTLYLSDNKEPNQSKTEL